MDILDHGYIGPNGSETDEMTNFFSPPKTNYAISSIHYDELLPLTPVNKQTTQIQFVSEPNPDFTDLSNVRLQFKIHLLKV